ncbi:HAD family hydrolase [Porphyromonas crevioricanis]|uniref:YjjG family noncanonical pyrimidine nucleotidase n=1 Tax=Porphyromonas crevioricanis TaxID=393921 RepID=UPI00052BC703|nr:YjjG family noncanonical pyrimidine nucleotidase [Porphyromonas crevioricanis]KGN88817.1 HAD family hydrolase [Porphyromonas crevioricanis]
MIKTLFVDLDDTLWDTFDNNKESLKELYVARNWGQHFASFEAFFDSYYRINDCLWDEYRRGLIDKHTLTLNRFRKPLQGVIDPTDSEILQYNDDFLSRTAQKTRTCPGALEVMPYLHRYYKICIVSNGFREIQRAKLENSGLATYVDHMVLSEDVGINKPHKRIFDRALSCCSALREETLMIGDSWAADIVGAHNAKIASIWYNPYKLEMPQDETRRPIHQVQQLTELLELL